MRKKKKKYAVTYWTISHMGNVETHSSSVKWVCEGGK
jgi:hypothetical protein